MGDDTGVNQSNTSATQDEGLAGHAGSAIPLAALRRVLRASPTTGSRVDGSRDNVPAAGERCELCDTPIPPEHRHLLEREHASLVCACTACSLLFEREGAAGGKYVLVPRRYLALGDAVMSDEQWNELMIPVGMAYIVQGAQTGRATASYPSPAGAMQSLLALESWEALLARSPLLSTLAPDAEALLVNRIRGAREHFIVPIDSCYELVGRIRRKWRGLSGGQEVWDAIAAFFDTVRVRAQPVEAQWPAAAVRQTGQSQNQQGEGGAANARPEL